MNIILCAFKFVSMKAPESTDKTSDRLGDNTFEMCDIGDLM